MGLRMSTQNEFGLSKELMEELFYIFTKYSHINKVVIFGNRTKGDYQAYEDIQLCIFGEEIFHDEWYEIINEIDEIYVPMGFNLLQHHKIIKEELKRSIDKEGIVIYERG